MAPPSAPAGGIPIAAVEQATGIARATLRIWERRYGFPQPGRDERDERSYSAGEVEKLRLIATLVARGLRPGRLVPLPTEELAALAGSTVGSPAPGAGEAGDPVIALLRRHDVAGLAEHLEESLQDIGLEAFVSRRMPELNELVGNGWARGALQVYEEHLYTEVVEQLVHHALARLPGAGMGTRPNVVLGTFSSESHGLGLLMAQALLALQGCRCISLGLRLPVAQFVSAAAAFDADVVGLSFSASQNPSQAVRALEQLRAELPPRVAIWAGGSCSALARRKIAGVQAVRHITDVPAAVAAWRATAPGA